MQFVIQQGPSLMGSFPIGGYPIGGGLVPNLSYVASVVPFPGPISSPWGLTTQPSASIGDNLNRRETRWLVVFLRLGACLMAYHSTWTHFYLMETSILHNLCILPVIY